MRSFLIGGFECSTPVNRCGQRIDEIELTGHDRCVREDYRLLRRHGIRVARDGVRWNLVDEGGRLNFDSAVPFIQASFDEGMQVIWDLFHYGYPADLDPFGEAFVNRFAAYCREFAVLLVRSARTASAAGPRFYTPVNEISFFAWAGGEVGCFAPHATGRGPELKRQLARAAICGMNAIRGVDPTARFVHCDPLVRVVAPLDAPWLEAEAHYFNDNFVTEAWDMLAGRKRPELGGTPAHLDILGVNYYGVNQWEHTRPESVLAEHDPRRAPLADLLECLHERYNRPMILAETASCGEDRPRWLRTVAEECREARRRGAPLHGLCVYPVLGMAEWQTLEYRPMGLWDRTEGDCSERKPATRALAAIMELQRRLGDSPLRMDRHVPRVTAAADAI